MLDPMPKTIEQFEPGRNKPCPCGSGIKFKKCCKGGYKNAVNSQASLNLISPYFDSKSISPIYRSGYPVQTVLAKNLQSPSGYTSSFPHLIHGR